MTALDCRWLVEGAHPGTWQMAVDEVLLESAAASGLATLRFYRWSQPTLSLGYFQPYAARESHAGSRNCAVVRRQTGGGAILHDRELTYSLAVPCAHPLAADAARLYEAVHDALIEVLAGQRLEARRRAVSHEQASWQPFLCFQRRSAGDVLLAESKICGSAQRRRRGAILQHGSLLLARSPCAAELPGIEDLAGRTCDVGEIIDNWGRAISRALGLALHAGKLSEGEIEAGKRLEREKYAQLGWTARR